MKGRVCRGDSWSLVRFFFSVSMMSIPSVAVAGPSSNPVELGQVAWGRNFDQAVQVAKEKDLPLLVLFQEVPGCGTCVNYGQQVLSHPLIVEAAETLFVPVAIYNNIPGHDEKVLQSFDEKAWNNPVVRIMSADRTELTPRVHDDYSIGGLASAMGAALGKLQRPVPKYLQLAAEEYSARARGLETATFAMHCFWEGEAALGGMPGVIVTQPGFVDKLEVVEVQFDPRVATYEALLTQARKQQCASRVFARNDAQHTTAVRIAGNDAVRSTDPVKPDKQPKYYLSNTPLRHVPMTELQAARVNAALHPDGKPRSFLSPRQLLLLDIIERRPDADWPNVIGAENPVDAWQAVQAVASSPVEGQ